jgi:hypothetical protein
MDEDRVFGINHPAARKLWNLAAKKKGTAERPAAVPSHCPDLFLALAVLALTILILTVLPFAAAVVQLVRACRGR